MHYAILRSLLWSVEGLSYDRAMPLARSYIKAIGRFYPEWKRVALTNLRIAGFSDHDSLLAEMTDSLARIGLFFSWMPRFTRKNILEWVRCEGEEHYHSARDSGRPLLFATGHVGNWELCSFAGSLLLQPHNVVARPIYDIRIDRFVNGCRELHGNRVVAEAEAGRKLIKGAKQGLVAAAAIDYHPVVDRGVFVNFFGTPAYAGTGFMRVAAIVGALIVPIFCVWHEAERKYVLRCCEPIAPSGDVTADTQRVHGALESMIRRYPGQWTWIHQKFKTRPPGEPSIYD